MESKSNIPTSEDKAWLAFKDCSSALETGKLAVELRPRSRDEETAFSGDYDYLMDSSRFEEIVQLFFRVCIENEVSFQILRRAAFKHQIILLGSDERRIIFEFWPHAELTTDTPLKGISFLTYQRFVEACEAGLREETLALLFVCHLFFKRKDPSHSQVQWRLENFSGRMSRVVPQDGLKAPLADKIRELLVSLKLSRLTLAEANHVALGLLSEAEIVLARQGFAKRQRMLAKMGRIFRGWGARIVPCVGPDGSGKTYFITSVLELVQQQSINASTIRFKKLFRRNKIYSHINRRYRKSRDIAANSADEQLAPFLFWVALPAYWLEILKSLNKKAVFMDRFFLEFMVRGYRENEVQAIKEIPGYSWLCRLIFEPRKLIVLTADYELIASRKEELSREAILDFYMRYISFAVDRKITNVLFLNTHGSGSQLAETCLSSIGLLRRDH